MKKLSKNLTTAGLILFVFIGLNISSCKKYIEVPSPKMSVEMSKIFSDSSATLSSVLNLYANTQETLSIYTALSADEIIMPPSSIIGTVLGAENTQANKLNVSVDASLMGFNAVRNIYVPLYDKINNANICIEGITASTAYGTAYKNQLIGECKFWRAWCYYYLTNLWGNVPLTLSTDVNINKSLPNSTSAALNHQILTDLVEARDLLSATNLSTEKIRVNKATVTAMLARVYFNQQNWPAAFAESNTLITSNTYQLETDLAAVFLKPSRETIFQIQSIGNTPSITGATRMPGFLAPLSGVLLTSYFNPNLLAALQSTDQRRTKWCTTFMDFTTFQMFTYPSKYKQVSTAVSGNEYLVMFRLAEQHLIRAEAAAHLNDFTLAEDDLYKVRNRAGLTTRLTVADLPTAVSLLEQERRLELFTEWGDRWLNLKRTGRINTVLPVTKLGTIANYAWEPYQALYPFSAEDIRANPNIKQNPDY